MRSCTRVKQSARRVCLCLCTACVCTDNVPMVSKSLCCGGNGTTRRAVCIGTMRASCVAVKHVCVCVCERTAQCRVLARVCIDCCVMKRLCSRIGIWPEPQGRAMQTKIESLHTASHYDCTGCVCTHGAMSLSVRWCSQYTYVNVTHIKCTHHRWQLASARAHPVRCFISRGNYNNKLDLGQLINHALV